MKHFLIGLLSTLFFVTGACLLPASTLAQFNNIKPHLNSLPTRRVQFEKGTIGSRIQNATDTIYILGAKAGQTLTLNFNSLGEQASVTLYGVDGKLIKSVFGSDDYSKPVSVRLPATGDYYIVGGSGQSNASYDFTVSIQYQ